MPVKEPAMKCVKRDCRVFKRLLGRFSQQADRIVLEREAELR